MSDPRLWFRQLASLLGAMPKTKVILLARSLPISFFECSPTTEIPASPGAKSTQIIASSFPRLSECSCRNHCALFLPQDALSLGLEAARGCQDPMPSFPLHVSPLLSGPPHMDLADTSCPPDCYRLPYSVGHCQPARRLTRSTLCLPDTHHLVIPVTPIPCSLRWSVRCLASPHPASVPGSHVQNLMCHNGNASPQSGELGVCPCPFLFVSPFTPLHHTLICIDF